MCVRVERVKEKVADEGQQKQARHSVVFLSGGTDDIQVFAFLCSAGMVLPFTKVSFYQDDTINHPTVSLFPFRESVLLFSPCNNPDQ